MSDERESAKDLPAQGESREVDAFLEEVGRVPAPAGGGRGRLIFALDATASRQPTWDQASHLQAEMFEQTRALGGLEVQLVFYRGYGECKASKWLSAGAEITRLMTSVACLAGRTQLVKVLRHALKESETRRIGALIFVGDAMEEDIDELGHLAGQLGLKGLRCFLFHEGQDPIARAAFEQIARLTGGACCSFDASAPDQLRDLLSAVAVYAAGGTKALADFSKKRGGATLRIAHQMK